MNQRALRCNTKSVGSLRINAFSNDVKPDNLGSKSVGNYIGMLVSLYRFRVHSWLLFEVREVTNFMAFCVFILTFMSNSAVESRFDLTVSLSSAENSINF